MVSLDARDNRIAVEGWTELSEIDPVDLVKSLEPSKAPLSFPPGDLAQATRLPLIAAGGIAQMADVQSLASLEEDGLVGMITGRAIYSGTLNLARPSTGSKKTPTPRPVFFLDIS